MQLTFFGHSTFLVEVSRKKILFDPFLKGNPLAPAGVAEKVEADYIFLTHGHADHSSDIVDIAKRTGAQCIAAAEISGWLHKHEVANALPMNHGGAINFDFGKARGVNAVHSSSLPDGSYGGNPLGFVFNTNEGDFYVSGDTALTLDMQLIPYWASLKFAVLPIGGHFTMDVSDAIHAAKFAKVNKIIGVHYDTFGYIKIDKDAAIADFAAEGLELLLPDPGVTIEL